MDKILNHEKTNDKVISNIKNVVKENHTEEYKKNIFIEKIYFKLKSKFIESFNEKNYKISDFKKDFKHEINKQENFGNDAFVKAYSSIENLYVDKYNKGNRNFFFEKIKENNKIKNYDDRENMNNNSFLPLIRKLNNSIDKNPIRLNSSHIKENKENNPIKIFNNNTNTNKQNVNYVSFKKNVNENLENHNPKFKIKRRPISVNPLNKNRYSSENKNNSNKNMISIEVNTNKNKENNNDKDNNNINSAQKFKRISPKNKNLKKSIEENQEENKQNKDNLKFKVIQRNNSSKNVLNNSLISNSKRKLINLNESQRQDKKIKLDYTSLNIADISRFENIGNFLKKSKTPVANKIIPLSIDMEKVPLNIFKSSNMNLLSNGNNILIEALKKKQEEDPWALIIKNDHEKYINEITNKNNKIKENKKEFLNSLNLQINEKEKLKKINENEKNILNNNQDKFEIEEKKQKESFKETETKKELIKFYESKKNKLRLRFILILKFKLRLF